MPDDDARITTPGWIDAEACMTVGVFLADDSLASELETTMPPSEAEFRSLLAVRRRELTAGGVSDAGVAYRLAVMQHVRESLRLRAEIRALPTTQRP